MAPANALSVGVCPGNKCRVLQTDVAVSFSAPVQCTFAGPFWTVALCLQIYRSPA